MKNTCFIFCFFGFIVFIVIVVLLSFPQQSFAKIIPHLITEGFKVTSLPRWGNGYVYFYKYLFIPSSTTKVFLSRNPDGTGSLDVGDSIQVHGSKTFTYSTSISSDYTIKHCQTPLPPLEPTDVTFATKSPFSILVRLSSWCTREKTISPIYLVEMDEEEEQKDTEPFLDLPWDYEGKGLSFTEAASAINSFFDHEYPLLSTSLQEPIDQSNLTRGYDGNAPERRDYSSHDGYDYGRSARVTYGEPVLAAAGGIATYMNSCGACGNAVLIDHENGYQTRYYHLHSEGLITNIPGNEVIVSAGQQIGKNGATGNVIPKNEHGAHIHFMVIEDKDKDGNFQNNIPDGITDPYGWQSTEPDPWENYIFTYGGIQRTGNKSNYLWKKKLDSMKKEITPNGGSVNTERYAFDFPAGVTNEDLTVNIQSGPVSAFGDFVSIGSSVIVTAQDIAGNFITNFQKSFEASSLFDSFDLSHINLETLSIYSSPDGVNWTKEETLVDLESKKATAQVDHLTYFALFAERIDTIPASTTATLLGQEGEEDWFRSDVEVSLQAVDNENGLGVDYILYRIDSGEWREYINPLFFSDEMQYTVEFYSVDKDENVEEVRQIQFTIDKSIPEADVHFDLDTRNITVIPISIDYVVINNEQVENKKERIKLIDKAGNRLIITGKDREKGKQVQLILESLQYNDGEQIILNESKLFIKYAEDKKINLLKDLDQQFLVKGDMKLRLEYNAKKDITKLLIKEKGAEKMKETYDGLKILHLITEKGTLKYSY